MPDDELRDDFGAQLTAALEHRSQRDVPTDGAATIRARARSRQVRLRAASGALAAAVVAAAFVLLVQLPNHDNGISTIDSRHPSASTRPSTTTTTTTTPVSSTTSTTTSTTIPNRVPVVVTADAVGPVRFGVATEADVRAAVGPPDATIQGSFGVAGVPDYRALGYGCANAKRSDRIRIGPYGVDAPPYCQTVYYVNTATATLAGFETKTTGYTTAHGTTVGTTGPGAASRESHPVVGGCFTGIQIGAAAPSGQAEMFVFVGTGPSAVVSAIAVDHPANSVGALFC